MPDIELSQGEADALLAMPKTKVNDDQWDYPGAGGSLIIPLASEDHREHFLLDISRGRLNLSKGKYQNRARQVVILARLDFGGPSHRNPDDVEVPCPHLHLYREGFGDKWASPVPSNAFSNLSDLWLTLQEFMRFCNVTNPPAIERGLFV